MSSPKDQRIGFLGIGAMGSPMARRLLSAGFPLSAWNRTRARADHLLEHGAAVYENAVDAIDGADIVVTMLETGEVVDDVLFGGELSKALPSGSTLIDMSSIPPAMARDHAARLTSSAIGYFDAPVSGGTHGAADGTLAIMVGGEANEFGRFSEFFTTLGKATYMGPAGSGQVAKLANQIIVGITIGAVAEGLALVRAAGVDPVVARQAWRGGFADSRVLEEHGVRMIEAGFEPGAASRLQLKDLSSALQTASEFGLELPITSLLETLFASLCARGGAGLDHSALFLEIERAQDDVLTKSVDRQR